MSVIEDDLKKAELEKINNEIAKIKSEKSKIDNEKKEIEKRLNTPYLKSKGFFQLLITGIAGVPLIWFYFTNAIEPILQKNRFDLEITNDSLNKSRAEYEKDTIRFNKLRAGLAFQLEKMDEQNKLLLNNLEQLKTDHEDCIQDNNEFKIQITEQINKTKYNLDFGQLNSYKIGFYFHPDKKAVAEELRSFLLEKGFKGRTQMYPKNQAFFDWANNPKGYEVRYEVKYERQSASKLLELMNENDFGINFKLQPVGNRTAGFISIFVPKDASL